MPTVSEIQKTAKTADALVKCMQVQGWELNSKNVEGPANSFLGSFGMMCVELPPLS